MPFGIGTTELLIVFAIIIILFGAKKLPGLGQALGTSMREFKESVSGDKKSDEQHHLPAADATQQSDAVVEKEKHTA